MHYQKNRNTIKSITITIPSLTILIRLIRITQIMDKINLISKNNLIYKINFMHQITFKIVKILTHKATTILLIHKVNITIFIHNTTIAIKIHKITQTPKIAQTAKTTTTALMHKVITVGMRIRGKIYKITTIVDMMTSQMRKITQLTCSITQSSY